MPVTARAQLSAAQALVYQACVNRGNTKIAKNRSFMLGSKVESLGRRSRQGRGRAGPGKREARGKKAVKGASLWKERHIRKRTCHPSPKRLACMAAYTAERPRTSAYPRHDLCTTRTPSLHHLPIPATPSRNLQNANPPKSLPPVTTSTTPPDNPPQLPTLDPHALQRYPTTHCGDAQNRDYIPARTLAFSRRPHEEAGSHNTTGARNTRATWAPAA